MRPVPQISKMPLLFILAFFHLHCTSKLCSFSSSLQFLLQEWRPPCQHGPLCRGLQLVSQYHACVVSVL